MEVLQIFDSAIKTEVIYCKSWYYKFVIKQESLSLKIGDRAIYLTEEEALALYRFLGEVLK